MSIGPVALSKNYCVRDVIRYVLTLYRKNKEVSQQVPLDFTTQPECYELRHIDDDSDSSSSSDEVSDKFGFTGSKNKVYYKPNMELPALELEQEIGEFDSLVLVLKKAFKSKKNVEPKRYEFLESLSQTKISSQQRYVHVVL